MTGSNPLSTKNATELPKYSKTLHFLTFRRGSTSPSKDEQKGNIAPEIVRCLMSSAVNVLSRCRFHEG
jgi:hypothetical protein